MAGDPSSDAVSASSAAAGIERLSDVSGKTFSGKTGRWLVGVGVVSLFLTLILSVLMAEDAPHEQTADTNAFSTSSVGHQALAEVLEAVGLDVTVSRHRSAERASRTRALLILEPEVGDKELERLAAMVARASANQIPTVLALPKWRVTETARATGWANRIERATRFRIDEILRSLDEALETELFGSVEIFDAETTRLTVGDRDYATKLGPTQCIEGDWGVVLDDVVYDDECVVVARISGTTIYVLADPELLSTMGLGVADHAPLLVSLLEDVLKVDGVVIDEVVHGYEKARTIWQELFRFPLVLVTFHLALLAVLALWTATHRFGKPEQLPPRVPAGKATLIENTATLLALGHHAGTGVKKYLEAALRQLARAYGLAPELSADTRLEHLAQLAHRIDPGHDLPAIAREVAALKDGRGRRAERRAQALALKIHRLKTEMLHGDRSGS